jgi:hypothetical protein
MYSTTLGNVKSSIGFPSNNLVLINVELASDTSSFDSTTKNRLFSLSFKLLLPGLEAATTETVPQQIP